MRINKKLNNYLRKTREESGKTQTFLASKINKHFQYISNVERSLCNPSFQIVKAYVKHCGADKETVGELVKKYYLDAI